MDEVVQYDWDSTKNRINEAKHGISFYDALALFSDPQGYVEEVTRIEHGERRFKAIGRVDDLLFTAIFTDRGNVRRIISVRRSRQNERRKYSEGTEE